MTRSGSPAATRSGVAVLAAFIAASAACNAPPDANAAYEQIADSRRLTAELLATFTRATDAANRAVMAVADEPARQAAGEARENLAAVQTEVEELGSLFGRLGYSKEAGILEEFRGRFGSYRALVETILDLSVENTNQKARRLSFGEAQETADVMAAALSRLRPRSPADEFRLKWLAASAIGAVREIQALEAPHIAEPTDPVMDRLEQRMAGAATTTRQALSDLAPRITPASRPSLDAAVAAFDRFLAVHDDILRLSRRNTNVRSLAMSLEQKRALLAPCEASLRALEAALAERRHGRG